MGAALWRRIKKIDWTNTNCFEKRLSRFFEVYSRFVFRHPWPFILVPAILSAAFSVGFFYRHEISDATYLYTPVGAQSKYEQQCINEKWPLIDGKYIPGKAVDSVREAQSIVSAKDGGNILRPEIAEAVQRLNLYITEKIKVTYKNRTYTYMDLCLKWDDSCYTNSHVSLVSTMYNNYQLWSDFADFTNLTYPMAVFGSTRGYLGNSLGGVEVNNTNGVILSAKAWFLLYQLKFGKSNDSYVGGLWELEFQKRLLEYTDPYVRITVMHSQTLGMELKRNAEKLAPRFILCFGMLVLFAMLATFAFIDGSSNFPYIDWVVSKPLLAFLGVVGAGIGTSTTIGLMAFCGYGYNQVVCVMPFLIVAVRLDNTFLMISALRHISRSLPAEKRITEAMAEAASAITVTVSTDFFSFITGVTADIPAVQIFCVYTAIAVVITFLYQLTFLLGLLVLAAKAEEKAQNSLILCMQTVPPKEASERGLLVRLFNQGTRVQVKEEDSMKGDADYLHADTDPGVISRWFQNWYSPVLMHWAIRTWVMVCFVLYIAVSSYLCTRMRQGLEPVKLLVRDSYAIPHYRLMERYFWHNGTEMQIVVNNAPNLANASERQRVKEMVKAFSNTSHSMGMASVQFWLYDYENYLRDIELTFALTSNMNPDDYYQSVQRFLSLNTYEKSNEDVYWGNGTVGNDSHWMIASFRLTTGLSNFEHAELQIDAVNLMRSIASDPTWADMNITTYNSIWMFVDQYQEILPNVVQEVASGVGFMILIALLLIPHPFIGFWVAVTIFSVDVGVVGFMTLWDINLDTISMLTIIMSIGFSVDFAAHVAHAFVVSTNRDDSLVDKVKKAMGEVAWPIVQGATSTLLGVIVLSDMDSYMVVAFFKTVFLVIIIAVIHGLVFLPVLLSIFVPSRCGGKKKAVGNGAKVYPFTESQSKIACADACSSNKRLENKSINGHIENGHRSTPNEDSKTSDV